MNKREKTYKINDLLSDLKAAEYKHKGKHTEKEKVINIIFFVSGMAVSIILTTTWLFLAVQHSGVVP